MEDVNHDVKVIEHNPLARREAIDRCGASPVLFA
jgi:hypothetical protein